jgi:hypothetical protein
VKAGGQQHLHKLLQVPVRAPALRHRRRRHAPELARALPHGPPLIPDGLCDRGRHRPGVGHGVGALRHGHGHAGLREQPRVRELVGAHGPRQHGHPGGGRLQHGVPAAVREEPAHGAVAQHLHLRRPAADHQPPRRRARLEPLRHRGARPRRPHERRRAPRQRVRHGRRLRRRQRRLRPEADVHDGAVRERVQPRGHPRRRHRGLPAAVARRAGVRQRAHREHPLGRQVGERPRHAVRLQRRERVGDEAVAAQVPEEELPDRLGHLVPRRVLPEQAREVAPREGRRAGDLRERDRLVVEVPRRRAAPERVRHGEVERGGGGEGDVRHAQVPGQRLRPAREEVGDDGRHAASVPALRVAPGEQRRPERRERGHEGAEEVAREVLGVLAAPRREQLRGRREGQREHGRGRAGAEQRRQQRGVAGRDGDGDREASRGEQRGQVEEREHVSLRRVRHKKHVRVAAIAREALRLRSVRGHGRQVQWMDLDGRYKLIKTY